MRRFIIYILLGVFFASCVGPMPAGAQTIAFPEVMSSTNLSKLSFPNVFVGNPAVAILKGLTIHPDKPLQFDFIVEPKGGENQEQLKNASLNFAKYFLASVAIPNDDMWVNLSPYEKNRIIPESFGQTLMGRDLLAQDYLLKQVTASLIHPDTQLGKEFWSKVYKQAQEKFGTTQVPINTFNKVWIMPDKATVWEHNNSVFVIERHLKVMLEADYLSLQKNSTVIPAKAGIQDTNDLASNIVRDIIIPALEKEVNEGETFAQLREIYNAMILATWYKKRMKDSFLGATYMNKNKVVGVGYKDLSSLSTSVVIPAKAGIQTPEVIYQQYLQTFKKGVFNFIKEEPDPTTGELIPRKYFSGGAVGLKLENLAMITAERSRLPSMAIAYLPTDKAMSITFDLAQPAPAMPASTAMVVDLTDLAQVEALYKTFFPDPTKATQSLEHFAYGLSIFQQVNLTNKPLKAIYGAAGAGLAEELLALNPSVVYMMEQMSLDAADMKRYFDRWWSPGPPKTVVRQLYYKFKAFTGYARKTDFLENAEEFYESLIIELQSLGLHRNEVDVYENEKNQVVIEFYKKHPLSQEEQKRQFVYIQGDVADNEGFSRILKDIEQEGGVDVYYQHAGQGLPMEYGKFLPTVWGYLKSGGFIVSNDHVPSDFMRVPGRDTVDYLVPDDIRQFQQTDSPSMKFWSDQVFRMLETSRSVERPTNTGYGWHMNIYRKDVSPAMTASTAMVSQLSPAQQDAQQKAQLAWGELKEMAEQVQAEIEAQHINQFILEWDSLNKQNQLPKAEIIRHATTFLNALKAVSLKVNAALAKSKVNEIALNSAGEVVTNRYGYIGYDFNDKINKSILNVNGWLELTIMDGSDEEDFSKLSTTITHTIERFKWYQQMLSDVINPFQVLKVSKADGSSEKIWPSREGNESKGLPDSIYISFLYPALQHGYLSAPLMTPASGNSVHERVAGARGAGFTQEGYGQVLQWTRNSVNVIEEEIDDYRFNPDKSRLAMIKTCVLLVGVNQQTGARIFAHFSPYNTRSGWQNHIATIRASAQQTEEDIRYRLADALSSKITNWTDWRFVIIPSAGGNRSDALSAENVEAYLKSKQIEGGKIKRIDALTQGDIRYVLSGLYGEIAIADLDTNNKLLKDIQQESFLTASTIELPVSAMTADALDRAQVSHIELAQRYEGALDIFRQRAAGNIKRLENGFWDNEIAVTNYVLAFLDERLVDSSKIGDERYVFRNERNKREGRNIKVMVDILRKVGIEYKSSTPGEGGLKHFFLKEGKLAGLLNNDHRNIGISKMAPSALLAFLAENEPTIQGLVDANNKDAIKPWEIEEEYWTKDRIIEAGVNALRWYVPEFREAMEMPQGPERIRAMADAYRREVLDKGEGGQKKLFIKTAGLNSLLKNAKGILDKNMSPGALLRFLSIQEGSPLIGLVNAEDKDALMPWEIEEDYWTTKERAVKAIVNALIWYADFDLSLSKSELAKLYREKVLGYKAVDSSKFTNGQVGFFYEAGRLSGLMVHPRDFFGGKKAGLIDVMRLVTAEGQPLAGLIDDSKLLNEALHWDELEKYYGTAHQKGPRVPASATTALTPTMTLPNIELMNGALVRVFDEYVKNEHAVRQGQVIPIVDALHQQLRVLSKPWEDKWNVVKLHYTRKAFVKSILKEGLKADKLGKIGAVIYNFNDIKSIEIGLLHRVDLLLKGSDDSGDTSVDDTVAIVIDPIEWMQVSSESLESMGYSWSYGVYKINKKVALAIDLSFDQKWLDELIDTYLGQNTKYAQLREGLKRQATVYVWLSKMIEAFTQYNHSSVARDKAMTKAPGGIDMNSDSLGLSIKRDGGGMPLPASQQDWAQVSINGFEPVFVKMELVNLPELIGTP